MRKIVLATAVLVDGSVGLNPQAQDNPQAIVSAVGGGARRSEGDEQSSIQGAEHHQHLRSELEKRSPVA